MVGDVSPSTHSNLIKFSTVENIVQAAAFARSIGFPLRHNLTVRWLSNNWDYHETLMRKIGDWLSHNAAGTYYVWTKEAKGGAHSHILLHLPADKAGKFRKLVMVWLKGFYRRASLPKGTVHCRQPKTFGNEDEAIRKRVAYILKGGGEGVCRFLNVNKRDRGIVDGKRAGVSQALGKSARKAAKSILPSGCKYLTAEMLETASVAEWTRERRQMSFSSVPNKRVCAYV